MNCAVQATCGGCPLLSTQRHEELREKARMVSDALAAHGITTPVVVDGDSEIDAGRFGYRNRLRMKVVDGCADFFNEAKRDGCPVVRAELWAAIEQVRAVTAADPTLLAGVDHLEVRVGDLDDLGLMLSSVVDRDHLGVALGSHWVIADASTTASAELVVLSYRPDAASPLVEVPLNAFVQVNSEVNRRLVTHVLQLGLQTQATTFLDLYSGAGNFSVPLAAHGLRGTAIESSRDALAALSESGAARSGLIECVEADLSDVAGVVRGLRPVHLVVADPPRAGFGDLTGAEAAALASLTLDTFVLIGCNVGSFARDVAALTSAGLHLESVTAFDMFPGTKHVETLAVLRAAPARTQP